MKRAPSENTLADVWDAYERALLGGNGEQLTLRGAARAAGIDHDSFETQYALEHTRWRVGDFVVHIADRAEGALSRAFRTDCRWLRPVPIASGPHAVDVLNAWNEDTSQGTQKTWGPLCTQEAPMVQYLNPAEPKHLPVVYAVSGNGKIAAMASVTLDVNSLELRYLQSKQRGAGSAVMHALDRLAFSLGAPSISMVSMNWIATEEHTADACRSLKRGTFTSLNVFYKHHGYRDTADACAPEWQEPARGIEMPIRRNIDMMSKRMPSEIDTLTILDEHSLFDLITTAPDVALSFSHALADRLVALDILRVLLTHDVTVRMVDRQRAETGTMPHVLRFVAHLIARTSAPRTHYVGILGDNVTVEVRTALARWRPEFERAAGVEPSRALRAVIRAARGVVM